MDLKSLIPAEFFTPQAKPRTNDHGKIFLRGDKVAVGWGRGCPVFNENLASARKLKGLDLGTYDPDAKVWVFNNRHAHTVLAEFPTLEATAEVEALAKITAQQVATGKTQGKDLHGSIELCGDHWNVKFHKYCPLFNTYLAHARRIKAEYRFSRGWNQMKLCWEFSRLAAHDILSSFPEAHFNHPAELRQEAAKYVPKETTVGEDAYAVRLLRTAEAILS